MLQRRTRRSPVESHRSARRNRASATGASRGTGRRLFGPELPARMRTDARGVGNTFGTLFRVTTFGESHGGALGAVVDGCPSQLAALRGGHPARPRPPRARPEHARHPAQGIGHRPHPERRVRGEDARDADRPPDSQRGRALRRLRRGGGEVPSEPRRLHLRREVRHPRLARRRAHERARDRGASGGGRDRPQAAGRALGCGDRRLRLQGGTTRRRRRTSSGSRAPTWTARRSAVPIPCSRRR